MKNKCKTSVIERYNPKIDKGLSNEQVCERISQKLLNNTKQKTSKSYLKIFADNIFTFFNFLWLAIFVALVVVKSYINLLFMVVVVLNTAIAIFQEIRSKKTVEKLSMITLPKTKVVRDGKEIEINSDEIVLDDILVLEIGNQIPTDAIILSGNVEVNESLLTGESKPIKKQDKDSLFAGSFITSGKCYARADKIGKDSYIQTIAKEAKKFKQPNSNLFRDLNKIIKYIGIFIIPIGILTLVNCYFWSDQSGNLTLAIEKTCGSLTGMIPAGMFLLISVALAVGVIKLAQKKTLVQDIYSIEMLARSNILCLDKTGTITDGTMQVKSFDVCEKTDENELKKVISSILSNQNTKNNTSKALEDFFGRENSFKLIHNIPFSSDRKFTACSFEEVGTYSFGAYEYMNLKKNEEILKKIEKWTNDGFRVLAVAHSLKVIKDDKLPNDMQFDGLIVIEDRIREDATETIAWFKQNGVQIKIISGDDPATVSAIGKRVGVENYDKFVNLEGKSLEEVRSLAKDYTIFGRVTPEQKHAIIKELKEEKNIVAMTGDGVNDTLALKEADCSIAMAEGSEVARNISHLVLLDSKFSSLPTVVEEGRRVINNVQQSSTLFLMKTVLTILLSVVLLACQIPYVFQTKNMFLLEFFVIGMPSFFLALLPNKNRIEGDFIPYVLKKSLPYGLLLLVNILLVIALGKFGILSESQSMFEVSTTSTIVMIFVGFINLIFLCIPFSKIKFVVCLFSLLGISLGTILLPNIFGMYDINLNVLKIAICLILISAIVNVIIKLIEIKIRKRKKRWKY